MSRLVAFGCSFTFGHGLEDCIESNGNPGVMPSKYAWPQVCADDLGISCVNMAECGLGNKHIAYRILNFDFEPDDIVVPMWSFFHRHSIICSNEKILDLHPGDVFDSPFSEGAKASKDFYGSSYLYNETNQIVENLMYMCLIDYYLKNHNISVVHTTFPQVGSNVLGILSALTENVTIPDIKNHYRTRVRLKTQSDYIVENYETSLLLADLKRWCEFSVDVIFNDMRQCGSLDCGHPNKNSHESFGERLSEHITTDILTGKLTKKV